MATLVVTTFVCVGCAGSVTNFIRRSDMAQLSLQFVAEEEISHWHSGRAKCGIIFVEVWPDTFSPTLSNFKTDVAK